MAWMKTDGNGLLKTHVLSMEDKMAAGEFGPRKGGNAPKSHLLPGPKLTFQFLYANFVAVVDRNVIFKHL